MRSFSIFSWRLSKKWMNVNIIDQDCIAQAKHTSMMWRFCRITFTYKYDEKQYNNNINFYILFGWISVSYRSFSYWFYFYVRIDSNSIILNSNNYCFHKHLTIILHWHFNYLKENNIGKLRPSTCYFSLIDQIIKCFSYRWPQCISILFLTTPFSILTWIAEQFLIAMEVFRIIVSSHSDTTRQLHGFTYHL